MKDIVSELEEARREVARRSGTDGEEVAVVLRRSYRAPVESVWGALTEPDRLRRWFAPVSGDLRAGGAFQVEGNVGGDIVRCEPPGRLILTWGMPNSVVDVRLSADDAGTALELVHTVPIEVAGSGAGALFVGPGWDIAVRALAGFLAGTEVADPTAFEGSLEGQQYSAASIAAWAASVGAGGTASPEEIAALTDVARAQFTPDLLAPT